MMKMSARKKKARSVSGEPSHNGDGSIPSVKVFFPVSEVRKDVPNTSGSPALPSVGHSGSPGSSSESEAGSDKARFGICFGICCACYYTTFTFLSIYFLLWLPDSSVKGLIL